MKILDLQQGTEEWHGVRATRFTASEAPAMMGVSKYQTRTQLLDQKATGLVPDVDDHQQRIFDKGHAAEAAARPIAERIIGEDLYPVTCEDDEGRLLASMDGLTMLEDAGFEHKLWNQKLAEKVNAGELEPHYTVQMDQQMLVSGAEKILFMCSDGTEDNCVWMWYERDENAIKALIAGWAQFEKDLASHKPAEAEQPKAEGKAPDALPALSVRVTGMVEASNLKEFEASARAALANIKTDLQTDEDFADAEKAVKFCDEVEKRLKATKEQVIGQMTSVDEVVRLIDSLGEDFRQKRLKLTKDVKDKKEQRKIEILNDYRARWDRNLGELEKALEKETGDLPVSMNMRNADFAGAMKGKKTIASLRSACDDELARAKIEANDTAELIRGNIQQLNEHAGDHKFLFRDFGQICQKPAEDFAAIVKSRIADYQAEQAKREAEEKAKQEAAAQAKAETAADPAPAGKKPAYEMPALKYAENSDSLGVNFQPADLGETLLPEDYEHLAAIIGEEPLADLRFDEEGNEYELVIDVRRSALKKQEKAA
ncbi:lambda-exonuclease family protein [Marinobacter adhaerens]|uniref:lambda-exonuclease family protein n=1 Tax=Marinobacter adhaerens TaxID=1033846 RepID=UPI003BA9B645